jgi:hypothetical protein
MAKSVQAAFSRFDLDDLRAVVGEQPTGIGAGVACGERQDAHASENLVGAIHRSLESQITNLDCMICAGFDVLKLEICELKFIK